MSNSLLLLHFDDGSRIMKENEVPVSSSVTDQPLQILNPRGKTPITTYYEIDRISNEILTLIPPNQNKEDNSDGFFVKVALQFPDELLEDAPEVSFQLEDMLMNKYSKTTSSPLEEVPLVFILGDTTYSSCCPDEIGAMHLNADVIVHYGTNACLSVSESLPVIYSFGVEEWSGLEECVNIVWNQIKEDDIKNIILVGERRYQNHLVPMATCLEQKHTMNIVVGQVPIMVSKVPLKSKVIQTCCHKNDDICSSDNRNRKTCCDDDIIMDDKSCEISVNNEHLRTGCIIGGLQVSLEKNELKDYVLLYIGDDSESSKSAQFMNTVLKCISSETKACWSFNPSFQNLSLDPMSILAVQRHINRRFYLTQKARLSNIIGILVGTLSQNRFQSVVASVRKMIEDSGRATYTFVVGKINVAKLANFGEVECFVLISCGETSILKDERDFHVPIITPMELEIALGEKEWRGPEACVTDFNDFLDNADHHVKDNSDEDHLGIQYDGSLKVGDDFDGRNSGDSDDEPYYSVITGTYVSKPLSSHKSNNNYFPSDPTFNQITEYKSEAAEYWKKREYKGLEANIGKDEAAPAVMGQTGIASDYGNK